jgi:hypothetical protein
MNKSGSEFTVNYPEIKALLENTFRSSPQTYFRISEDGRVLCLCDKEGFCRTGDVSKDVFQRLSSSVTRYRKAIGAASRYPSNDPRLRLKKARSTRDARRKNLKKQKQKQELVDDGSTKSPTVGNLESATTILEV